MDIFTFVARLDHAIVILNITALPATGDLILQSACTVNR